MVAWVIPVPSVTSLFTVALLRAGYSSFIIKAVPEYNNNLIYL